MMRDTLLNEVIEKCNICGGGVDDVCELNFHDLIGMSERYTQKIAICKNCGYILTKNPFDEEQLNNRYKNFSKFEFDDRSYFLSEKEDYKKRCHRQKEFIDRVVGLKNIHSMLEIGAASGYNLSIYAKDFTVYGIEPSAVNCKNAKKYYDLDMFCGVFNEYDHKERYDLIFLSHILEHIVNPRDFIEKCSELNNKYIFIEVPTFDYKFVDEPFGMFVEEHVNMFMLESLQNMMNACGYRLLDADIVLALNSRLPAGYPSMATVWAKDLQQKNKFKVLNRAIDVLMKYIDVSLAELKRIDKIISSINDHKRIGIWGVGHHASMLLANTCLKNKNIVRVYDSDEKKWGEQFAGCRIGKFSELDVYDKNIDLIIITTYTAQNSIENVLKPYENKIEIISLY